MSCRHSVQLLKQLRFQLVESVFCDVTVRVSGGQRFSAHLCLLAACSAKLHSLSLSAASQHMTERVIVLDMLTAQGFQPVLEFIYTGSLPLTGENIDEVFAVARYLDLSDVIESCSKVYKGISSLDVLSLKTRSCECAEENGTEWYVVKHSMERMKNERIMKLSLCQVKTKQTEESSCGLSTSADVSSASTSFNQEKKKDSHDTMKTSFSINCAEKEHNQKREVQQAIRYQNLPETGRPTGPDQDRESTSSGRLSSNQPQHIAPPTRRMALRRRSKCNRESGLDVVGREKDGKPDTVTLGLVKCENDEASCSEDHAEGPSSADTPIDVPEAQRKVVPEELAEMSSVSDVGGKLSCSVCGKCCTRGSGLTRHLRVHSAAVFSCSSCDLTFSNPIAYKRHVTTAHDSKRAFPCSFPGCNFVSDRLSNVERHAVIHSDERVHSCNRCGQTFAQDNGLTSHLRSCTQTRCYLCDLCGAAFNHLQSMRSHRRIHTGEKPFRCAECDAHFADYRNLKRHRRIHSNAFPYECVVCAQKFRHSNSLKAHHLSCHQVIFGPGSSSRPRANVAHSRRREVSEAERL